MYRIIMEDSGEVVGTVERPRYIIRKSDGIFIETDEERAQGVAYQGTPYNLFGRDGVGVDDTVILFEFNAGEVIAETAAMAAEIEDAMCEQDADVLERLAEIEDALCELDKI